MSPHKGLTFTTNSKTNARLEMQETIIANVSQGILLKTALLWKTISAVSNIG